MSEREWSYIAMAGAGLPLLLYLALFAFRKDTALRGGAIFTLVGLFLATRAGLVACGLVASRSWWVLPALYACLAAAMLLFRIRALCVHAPVASVRAEIDEACRRLFIHKEEPEPGVIHLTAKGTKAILRLVPQSASFTGIVLPRANGSPKLTLFLAFLLKRYPGPIPRIRIELDRR